MKPTVVALVALALSPFVFSQARAEQRFAYVDMQRALLETEEGRSAKAKLKSQFDAKQKQLDAKQDELKRDNENLEKLAREGVVGPEKLAEKRAELEKKLMEVTKLWQDSQKALSEDERRLTQEIFAKMSVVIKGIAEAEGFTMVFDKNESGLVYAPDSLEITNELVRKYNAKHGAGGAGKAGDVPKAPAGKDAKPAPKKP